MILDAVGHHTARIKFIALFIFLGLGCLVVKLYHLQVGQGKTAVERARQQSVRTILLSPARGLVADRWGVPLAELRPSVDIDLYLLEIKSNYRKKHRDLPFRKVQVRRSGVDKAEDEVDIVKVVEDSIAPLRAVLGNKLFYDPDALQLHQRIRENIPFQLKSDLSFEELSKIVEQNPVVPGVNIAPRPVRRYAYGATGCHLLGYVGKPEEAKILMRDERKIEVETIGKTGIEFALDDYLQGNPGYRNIEVDSRGSVQRILDQQQPTLGGTVYLTIDLRVQQIVEKAMAGVGRGACVVMDVHSGDILAMASVPNYDPNTIGTKEGWQDVARNETKPLLNRALGAYAPGSIFKTVVALAALKYDVVTPLFSTTCYGGMQVSDRYRKCWSFDKGGCGTLPMLGAIRRSCNVFFYTVGIKTGITKVHDVATRLGLGKVSGIPLKGESAGTIPSLEWMKKEYPRDRWSNGHMANMAIGQGFVRVTPLQMTAATAAIANGGTCYYPRLISKVMNANGEVIREDPVRVEGQLDMPEEKVEVVREGMRAVVNEGGGTGSRAALENYVIAGKTGTAQFPTRINGRNVKDQRTWFISFGPYDEPRYAICLMVEGGASGGATCAPIVGQIYREIFALENSNQGYELTYLQPYRGHFDGIEDIIPEESVPQLEAPSQEQ